jgi:cyanophycinase-like exopeptidase
MRAALLAGVTLVGIDEATALVVSGQEWVVLGKGKVAVYDAESLAVFTDGQHVLL